MQVRRLRLRDSYPVDPIDEQRGGDVWQARGLSLGDLLLSLDVGSLRELDAVITAVDGTGEPLLQADAGQFRLESCRRLMGKVRERLVHGPGAVILDRIPVECYEPQQCRTIASVLAQLLAPVVSQTADGVRLYDVRDSGKEFGSGVRRSITNLGQPLHTDGGWLNHPPRFVGLFCVRSAARGGASRVASLAAAHDSLRRAEPDLLARLYRPFWWDRQAEHAPEESKVSYHPVYHHGEEGLTTRYYEDYIANGYRLAEERLDACGEEALAALRELIDSPENVVEFRLAPGQFEYLNNHRLAHARSAYEDARRSERRHLIRVWNRPDGGVELER